MQDTDLAQKRILLLGLGVENRAVGQYLSDRGIPFSAADATASPQLAELRQAWGGVAEAWHLGPGYLEAVSRYSLIFRTPGMHPSHPILAGARGRGAAVWSQARLFMDRCPAPITGITGTKGKGTTARLLECMLKAGHPGGVWVGGNIGTPPLSFLDRIAPTDAVVLELSSFQLQDLDRSPQVAVLLSVTGDHLDWHGSVAEYAEAKSAICRHQGAGDVVVADAACPASLRLARRSLGRQFQFGPPAAVHTGVCVCGDRLEWHSPEAPAQDLLEAAELAAPGRHNLANAAAAATAALVMGAPAGAVRAGAGRFRPLPHRLEPVGRVDGVTYCNDSLATNPDAAVAALEAFDEPVVLIAGGSSKGANFTDLAGAVAARQVRAVVLLGEEGQRLAGELAAAGYRGEVVRAAGTMAEAVGAARGRARPGDVVLLSPACASFGMFRDYAERGAAFTAAVRALGGETA